MSKAKKKLLIAFSAAAICGVLAGCGREDDAQQSIDSTKTQLYVKYYNGGLRREWIDEICSNFEKDYADYSFETGKVGVQIMKEFEKLPITADALPSNQYNVYIMEGVDYLNFVSKNTLMDITDVVTSKAPINATEKEEMTIESKMYADSRDFYNLGTDTSPRYYGIPFYENACSINYNVDLFDDRCYYFAKDQTAEGWSEDDLNSYEKVSDLFVTSLDEEKSLGPDGKTGTIDGVDYSWDDGLPATLADFRALLTYMSSDGVTPIAWNGYETGYLTSLALSAWVRSTGYEEMKNILTFSGTSTKILDLDNDYHPKKDSDGNYIYGSNLEVNSATVGKTHRQKGLLDACEFVDAITCDKDHYLGKGMTSSFMHTDAQECFVNGMDDLELVDNSPIGMLVEGTWWNSEATGFYKGNDKMTKKFGIMPIPHATAAQIGSPNVSLCDRDSSIFINAKTPSNRVEAAKTFAAYLNSDRSMNTFSRYTDMVRLMDYELTDETLSEMTYYGNRVNKFFHDPNTKHLDWRPLTESAATKTSALGYRKWGFSIDASNDNPFDILIKGKASDGVDLFAKINKYYDVSWSA